MNTISGAFQLHIQGERINIKPTVTGVLLSDEEDGVKGERFIAQFNDFSLLDMRVDDIQSVINVIFEVPPSQWKERFHILWPMKI